MHLKDLLHQLERRRERRRARLVRWPVRVGVWVLFAGALVGGFTALGAAPDPVAAPGGGDMVRSTQVIAGGAEGLNAQDAPVVIPSYCGEGQQSGAVGSARDCSSGNVPPGYTRFASQPLQALPAWRWNAALGEYMSNLGTFEVGAGVTNSVGAVTFQISSVLWGITTFLINFADRADFFKLMSGSVNSVFVKVTAATWPLLALGYLLVLVRISREILRGDVGGVMRLMAGFVIPVAFITVMAQSVNNSPASTANGVFAGQGIGTMVTGTPSWMANQVIGALDQSGNLIGAVFQPVAPDSSQFLGGNTESTYSCRPYIDALTSTYLKNTEGEASGGPSLMINQMWLASSYEMWSQAVFGNQLYRHKASCHAAEWWSKIPANEQVTIANSVYGGTWNTSVFSPTGRDFGLREWSEEQWHFGMWQACTDTGITPEWKEAVAVFDVDEAKATEMCTKWRTEGMGKDIDIDTVVEKAYMKANEISETTVSRWIQASLGKSSEMLLMGFGSLLSSMVYLWAFAGLAIGVIASKLGLVIALMVLPFTLTLIGLGMESGGRLLRWTASLCGIDLVFTAIMALLLLMTTLGVSLLISGPMSTTLGAGGVQAGLGRALSVCLVPIGSVMATNRVLKQAGLGSTTNPVKSLGLVGRASAKAYGADTTTGYMRAGYKNKKERAMERYQSAKGAVTGAQSALDRVSDPFNTGRTRLKREAAAANKLAEANPGNPHFEKMANQAYARWQTAEHAHTSKKDAILSAPKRAGQIVSNAGQIVSGAGKVATGTGMVATGGGAWAGLGMVASGLGDLKEGVSPEDREALEMRHRKLSEDRQTIEAAAQANNTAASTDSLARADAQAEFNKEYHDKTHHQVRDPITGNMQSMKIGDEARSAVGAELLAAKLAEFFAASLGQTSVLAELRNGDINSLERAVSEPTRRGLADTWANRWGVDRDQVLVDDYGNAWLNQGAFSDMRDVPEALRSRPEMNVDAATWAEWTRAAGGDAGALATMVGSQMVASGYARVEGGQAVIQSVDPGRFFDARGTTATDPDAWGTLTVNMPGYGGTVSALDMVTGDRRSIDLGNGAASAEIQHIISGSQPYNAQAATYANQAAGVGTIADAVPQAAVNVDQTASVLNDFLGRLQDTLSGGVRVSTDPTRVVLDEIGSVKLDPGSIAEVGSVVADAVSGFGSSGDTADLGARMSEAVESMREVAGAVGILAAAGQAHANGPSEDGNAELGALIAAVDGVNDAASKLADAAGNNDMEAVRQILEQFVGQMTNQTAAAGAVSEDLSKAADALADAARAAAESTARYGDQPTHVDVSEVVAELQGIRAQLQ